MYLFRNPPTWIPKYFFRQLNQLLLLFLWGSLKQLRYKLPTLIRLTLLAGLDMQNFFKYFIATRLITVHW